MKVLVVGGGGREHAIVWKLSQSPLKPQLYCAPGNAGIGEIAELVPVGATEIEKLVSFAKAEGIDFVVIGPDDPLSLGITDRFEEEGFMVYGPRKNAAIIESSKAFSKEFMKRRHIPTAEYEVFSDYQQASAYINCCTFPVVVKADGLALGKGVLICNNLNEARAALEEIMVLKKFGSSGDKVVIEEYLEGKEVTILAFCDGSTVVPMVSSQDYKRAYDNDQGLNTGGMGTKSPAPHYTKEIEDYCMAHIFLPTVRGLAEEGRPFQGTIYFGLMLTDDGPKVIEYNSRFGDPEAQVVLPRLKSDLLSVMIKCREGRLGEMEIKWDDKAAVCVMAASGGYPEEYEKGVPIYGAEQLKKLEDVYVFHSGTSISNGQLVTNGGRVLGVTALGKDVEEAKNKSYGALVNINFDKMYYRKDIGK